MTVLWATSSLLFSLSHQWHKVCLLNSLLWDRSDYSLKSLNLVSMEDAVKLSTRMRWFFFLVLMLVRGPALSCWRSTLSIGKLGLTRRSLALDFVWVSMKKGLRGKRMQPFFHFPDVGWLLRFYGISTFVGYLTPNSFFVNSQFYWKQSGLASVHIFILAIQRRQTVLI